MDLKEMGINTRNWVDFAQNGDYWRALVYAASLRSSLNVRDHVSHPYSTTGNIIVL